MIPKDAFDDIDGFANKRLAEQAMVTAILKRESDAAFRQQLNRQLARRIRVMRPSACQTCL